MVQWANDKAITTLLRTHISPIAQYVKVLSGYGTAREPKQSIGQGASPPPLGGPPTGKRGRGSCGKPRADFSSKTWVSGVLYSLRQMAFLAPVRPASGFFFPLPLSGDSQCPAVDIAIDPDGHGHIGIPPS